MKPKTNTRTGERGRARKRFRLEKLEERIAPRVHYNPQSKAVGGGRDTGTADCGTLICAY